MYVEYRKMKAEAIHRTAAYKGWSRGKYARENYKLNDSVGLSIS